MRCRHENIAYLYPAGMLAGEEKSRFEAHLRECDACKAIVSEEARTRDLYRLAPAPALPSGFEERILQRLEKEEWKASRTAKGLNMLFRRKIIPAAAIVAAAMLFVIFFLPGGTETKAAAPNTSYAGIYLSADDSFIVTDDDGDQSYLSTLNRAYTQDETEQGM